MIRKKSKIPLQELAEYHEGFISNGVSYLEEHQLLWQLNLTPDKFRQYNVPKAYKCGSLWIGERVVDWIVKYYHKEFMERWMLGLKTDARQEIVF